MQYTIQTEFNGRSLTVRKMMEQITENFPNGIPAGTIISFQGDPFLNDNTNVFLIRLAEYHVHPIITTALPQRAGGTIYLNSLVNMMNENYKAGEILLRLVLGSTSERVRENMFGPVFPLRSLAKSFNEHLPEVRTGKVVLSFDPFAPVKVETIKKYFSPEKFSIELRLVDKVIEPTLFDNQDLEGEIRRAGYELIPCDLTKEVHYNEGNASTNTGGNIPNTVGA